MRIVVVDDERLARKELIRMLDQYSHLEVIAEANNGETAIKTIENLRPDLVFLDIQMPDMDGFEVLDKLEYIPKVIFVTAFDEFAVKAFEVNALDYLLKPVETDRLEQTLSSVLKIDEVESEETNVIAKKYLGGKDQIFIKDGDKCWFVKLSEVSKFESIGNYARVYFQDEKPLILKSLNKLESRLDSSLFFRANRKYIINLEWIDKIENMYNGGLRVTLKEGTEVEISRRQSVKFKSTLSL